MPVVESIIAPCRTPTGISDPQTKRIAAAVLDVAAKGRMVPPTMFADSPSGSRIVSDLRIRPCW